MYLQTLLNFTLLREFNKNLKKLFFLTQQTMFTFTLQK